MAEHKQPNRLQDERGAAMVMFALSVVMLVAFSSMAIDIGHIMVVRNELQNAADASALAGAAYFYPQVPPASPQPPAWSSTLTQATGAIGLNKADGVTLIDCQASNGYWNYAHTPPGLQGTGITPGTKDFPAVQVTVTKSAGHNGGPVQNFLAAIVGIGTFNVTAVATAIMAPSGTALQGALLPVAIAKVVADQMGSYDSPSTPFKIGSNYQYLKSVAGQWTSFQTDASDTTTLLNLIVNGNSTPLSVGSFIWIEPATKNPPYSSIPIGTNVLLPIVQNISTHASAQIIGFVGFHITASVAGSGKYIQGYFLPTFYAGDTGGVGPNYGAYSPPSLVR